MVATAPAASITSQQLVACIPIAMLLTFLYFTSFCAIFELIRRADSRGGKTLRFIAVTKMNAGYVGYLFLPRYLRTKITGNERWGDSEIAMTISCFPYRFLPLVQTLVFCNLLVYYVIPIGRPRRRWEDNIKMDIQEVGCEGMDWIDVAQHRDRWLALVNTVMKFRVPQNSGKFLTSWEPVSFSRRTLHHGVSK